MPKCSHSDCKKEVYLNENKCIFHCDKNEENDWFKIDKEGNKKWRDEKVKEFWKAIREKMEIEKNNKKCNEHNFSYFVFPEFEKGFYNKKVSRIEKIILADGKEREIDIYKIGKDFNFFLSNNELFFGKNVNFSGTTFSGKVNFLFSTFSGKVNFLFSTFLKEVYFSDSTFLKEVDFSHSIFSKEVYFSDSTFSGKAYFLNSIFSGKANFSSSIFSKETYFSSSIFSKEVDFSHSIFSKETYFSHSIFSVEYLTKFEETKFNGYDLERAQIMPAEFENVTFSKVLFRKVDLSRISFLDSDIEKAKFDGCFWGKFKPKFKKNKDGKEIIDKFIKSKNREMIWDEYDLKNKQEKIIQIKTELKKELKNLKNNFKKNKNFSQKYFWFIKEDWRKKIKDFKNKRNKIINENQKKILKVEFDYKKIETIYRQLKKNFDDKADFQTADDFYCGEMEMRGKALIQEVKNVSFYKIFSKNYGKRFLLKLYKLVSNYNLNPTKSFICLVITILVFTILFYFAINGLNLNSVKTGKIDSILSFISAFKKPIHYSFTSSTPLLSFPEEIKEITNGWLLTIHYIQKIFSTIIWTLLILSIRRKFKR